MKILVKGNLVARRSIASAVLDGIQPHISPKDESIYDAIVNGDMYVEDFALFRGEVHVTNGVIACGDNPCYKAISEGSSYSPDEPEARCSHCGYEGNHR